MRCLWISCVIWVVLAFGAAANPDKMQSVIDRQIEAFQADDFAGAMAFASPGLQRYFGTPERFGQMVTQGYPMVWRPGTVRYLENRTQGDVHWQRVMITDMQGKVHVLDYRMIETADGWRINGVQILDAADLSV